MASRKTCNPAEYFGFQIIQRINSDFFFETGSSEGTVKIIDRKIIILDWL